MKSLGDILKAARLEQKLTLEQASAATRIEVKYLKALEGNLYHLLPPPTFTKGFIKNYARFLGRPDQELIAVYRRDFRPSTTNSLPITKATLARPLLHLPKSTLLLFTTGLIVFLGYLAFQYRALLTPPPLTITQPQNNAVTTSPLVIEGRTSTDSVVTVNQDTDLSPNQSGIFLTQVNLFPGEHQLEITATNRFGRTAKKTLIITILSQ